MTTIRRALGALALSLLAGSLGAQEVGLELGAMAPGAAVETLDGKAADLKDHIGGGRPTLIEFWATWCSSCKMMEPKLVEMHKKYGARVRFVGVAVSANQSAERVRRYLEDHLVGFTHFYDARGKAVDAYDVPATSHIVVLDGTGKVVYAGVGGRQDIEPAIQKALR